MIDWTTVEWDKTDADLGRALGVSREAVRKNRAKLGLRPSTGRTAKFDEFKAVFAGMTKLSYRDAVAVMPSLAQSTFSGYCKRLGIQCATAQPSKRPWHLMDWRLSSVALSDIWLITPQTVMNYRTTHKPGEAMFRGRVIPPEHKEAFDRQWKEAVEWRANQS